MESFSPLDTGSLKQRKPVCEIPEYELPPYGEEALYCPNQPCLDRMRRMRQARACASHQPDLTAAEGEGPRAASTVISTKQRMHLMGNGINELNGGVAVKPSIALSPFS